MKVWINKRLYGYSGGMIIVAANSVEEALEVFHNDERFSYMYTKLEDGSYSEHEYYPGDWVEEPRLTFNGNKPCVIDECGYSG